MTDPESRHAEPVRSVVDTLTATFAVVPARPPEVTYTFEADDLLAGVPEEYHGARLSEAVRRAIVEHASVTLMGPPGTGKTRQCWGALIEHRRAKFGRLVGQTMSWRWRSDAPTRAEWVTAKLCRTRVAIISESADIAPRRFDRAWLQSIAELPGLVCVDDIGFSAGNDWLREAVYHLANERRAQALKTLWTTNLTQDQLRDAYSPAIASRLLSGKVISVEGKDRRLS